MSQAPNPIYCPALRMKAGELEGVRQLAADVADRVLPRFIVPPQSERDETNPLLFDVDDMPDVSVALGAHWRQRPALIDATHIIDEYGRDRLGVWLPALFERARKSQVRAIPMALLTDLGDAEVPAFRAAITEDESIRFAICVQSEAMVDPELSVTMQVALDRLNLTARDCAVLADFGGSDFTSPTIVAPIISAALETLQDFGPWQQIIFQGTHYPDTNPAKEGTAEIWPRNEWLAWRRAVKFDPTTAEYMTFGDYAADSAKMKFGISNASAIRHIRWATSNDWRIQRAVKSGKDVQRMHEVYKAIFESAEFAGEGFSRADAYVAYAAKNPSAKPGNATTWRQLNTTHHITQAVADIAKIRGIVIKKAPGREVDTQLSLLETVVPTS
ncbi:MULTISPECIES: hypothetical protein [unclassified Mesorhizobium]|uniref:beta family protein n=1 Tax=unclassified Mesorhizobium TaxID=325217 RepID=UPI000BAF8797|nr:MULTISPECIES: hypothetical protein [unclassified Mesorhizobium]PBC19712.1 hypothetical protein CK226_27975 [Mesorhizobium sp. WSM4311]TRD02115.1 hypothetical protein FJV82_18865 [Mesorhizobium sp. WSM4305]